MLLAQRIELSQRDEIDMMREWLQQHEQEAPTVDGHHGHDGHGASEALMPGMLTAEQMSQLEQAHAGEFDRLFLELMIQHHKGALVMVEELLDAPGGAQESTVFGFTTDITADQSAEIDRMTSMLESLSSDPRVGLDAGFQDAGEALSEHGAGGGDPEAGPGSSRPTRRRVCRFHPSASLARTRTTTRMRRRTKKKRRSPRRTVTARKPPTAS